MGAVYEAIDQRLDTMVALKETLFVFAVRFARSHGGQEVLPSGIPAHE